VKVFIFVLSLFEIKETLNKSLDRLRTNGKWLISFVVSLSNHERNQLNLTKQASGQFT